jgi:hypothetical protein
MSQALSTMSSSRLRISRYRRPASRRVRQVDVPAFPRRSTARTSPAPARRTTRQQSPVHVRRGRRTRPPSTAGGGTSFSVLPGPRVGDLRDREVRSSSARVLLPMRRRTARRRVSGQLVLPPGPVVLPRRPRARAAVARHSRIAVTAARDHRHHHAHQTRLHPSFVHDRADAGRRVAIFRRKRGGAEHHNARTLAASQSRPRVAPQLNRDTARSRRTRWRRRSRRPRGWGARCRRATRWRSRARR